ncbi:HAD domain-containing protein [Leucobacter sp. cx-169]|uniref:HAD domain-containing protein n=1 Tax=Leucobacter sp. cx-169 TaxID=2770549 RepID=UPI00165E8C55|nr:HAD domain-containing protein [Leucobacter sp. cx-169]MBC9927224.1 hypothetical protein [Leucobacter sp. cx-169]
MSVNPVLYLDVDGVINFAGGRGSHAKKSGLGHTRRTSVFARSTVRAYGAPAPAPQSYEIRWSAELLRKLSAIEGLDIVWLSTWRDATADLERALSWRGPVGCLDWVDGPAGAEHSGKVPALLQDQAFRPRPFIWADDEAHDFYLPEHRARTAGTPQLLIAPVESIGLTAANLDEIAAFAHEHRASL